jgi:hypothetical protein
MVKNEDVLGVALLEDKAGEEVELGDGWDAI